MHSLSDLKAEVAAQDAEELKVVEAENSEPFEQPEAAAQQQSDDQSQEGEPSETGSDEKPEWAQTDGKQVPLSKHIDVRDKLKERARKAEEGVAQAADEVSRLRQEVARLSTTQQPVAQVTIKPPTLAECDYDESLYGQKYAQYTEQLIESKLANHQSNQMRNQQQTADNQARSQEINKHYERAEKIISDGTVSLEVFENADQLVRSKLTNVIPGFSGDQIVNTLIAGLGDGSEKVMVHLGLNGSALAALEESLRIDPRGLRAAAYLGELKAKFNSAPINKLSNAPKPDASLKGNARVSTTNQKAAFDKAMNSGSLSEALKAKREAKAAGVDTSKW